MHGNVWEWCQDWYWHDNTDLTHIDPIGLLSSGAGRVVRSGNFLRLAHDARSALRAGFGSLTSNFTVGFRVVRSTDTHGEP